MRLLRTVVPLLVIIAVTDARWRKSRSDDSGNFIGLATNELSKAILQSYVDDDSNLAFSPFGFSAILAILAEGAAGETRSQLKAALKLPDDAESTRKSYNRILKRFYNSNEYRANKPEFKNWFYVYKNYTINEDYRKVLETYYLTDVKSVNRYDSELYQHRHEQVDKEEQSPIVKVEMPVVTKDIPVAVMEDEDKKTIISFAMEDKPQKPQLPEVEEIKPGKNIKEKIKLANTFKIKDQQEQDTEIMEAVEARNVERTARNLGRGESATHTLSANRVGSKEANSLMILFNGLYFRGTWKNSFKKVDEHVFYVKPNEKKPVPMMSSKGLFKFGTVPGLTGSAIELPYEDDRYSLIVVKPKARDGLKQLSDDLIGFSMYDLTDMLYPAEVTVRMPMFFVETTTKPLSAFAKFGVTHIFGPNANLSGISPVEGLFVQEMVQHVSVKVDDGNTLSTQISAADVAVPPLERSRPLVDPAELEGEQFLVDHPFLFFVRDIKENIMVAAGKITNPVRDEDAFV